MTVTNLRCCACKNNKWTDYGIGYDRMLAKPEVYYLVTCERCGIITYKNRLTKNQLQDHYPSQTYYSYSSKGGVLQHLRNYLIQHVYNPTILSRLFSLLIKQVPAIPGYVKQGKVLDVGCGMGQTLLELQKLGWRGYGVEIDKQAVVKAHEQGLQNVFLGGYNKVKDFKDNFFDAIRLYHVIEHLDNPNECLEILQKKLKHSGELIIGTPNRNSVTAFLFRTYWYNLDVPRHIWLFDPKTLTTILEQHGFAIKQISFCSGAGIAGSIQYIIEDKLGKKVDLVSNFFVFLLFYPIEWVLDKLGKGDVMIITAKKI